MQLSVLYFLYPAFLTLLAFSSTPTSAAKKPTSKDAILLSQVRTLTLRSNAKTSHRRVSAIPQLTCKGPGCAHYKVDILRCTNQGSSYGTEDIEWSCTASLPSEFKLGSTDVICEGYSSPDDDYILKGSCGVEYRLLLTDAGEEKYGYPKGWLGSSSKSRTGNGEGWTWGSILLLTPFVAIVLWILYEIYTAQPAIIPRLPRQPRGGFWGGGWGGGGPGGGPPRDPPPPYSRKPGSSSEAWSPGFWSGTAAGAAAGYLAGSRGNRQQTAPVIPQTGGGWFGGGNNGDNARSSPSRASSSPRRSDSGSSSSARYESTGFGSTSRR